MASIPGGATGTQRLGAEGQEVRDLHTKDKGHPQQLHLTQQSPSYSKTEQKCEDKEGSA